MTCFFFTVGTFSDGELSWGASSIRFCWRITCGMMVAESSSILIFQQPDESICAGDFALRGPPWHIAQGSGSQGSPEVDPVPLWCYVEAPVPETRQKLEAGATQSFKMSVTSICSEDHCNSIFFCCINECFPNIVISIVTRGDLGESCPSD